VIKEINKYLVDMILINKKNISGRVTILESADHALFKMARYVQGCVYLGFPNAEIF
jgi:hypothetical protein